MAGGPDPLAHETGDRSTAGAHLKTALAGTDPEPIEMATRDPVVKLRETRETAAGLRSGVVERVVRCGRCGIHVRFTTEVLSCRR